MIDELLPDWAERKTDKFEVGAQLCTRDGRRTGNAYISDNHENGFVVKTYYNEIVLNLKELEEMFYTPEYIMKDK